MRVAALSLSGLVLTGLESYRKTLAGLLKETGAELAVLPAYTAMLLYFTAKKTPCADFGDAVRMFAGQAATWNRDYLDLHGSLARELGLYLVAGTTVETSGGKYYHTAYCFDPAGRLCASQRQTHLSRAERALGFSRGEELTVFDVAGLKAGLVVGTDARHPEVGRILALRQADLLLHPGAMEAGCNCRPQVAGMWAQVQQNQCWAVEAQLFGKICGCKFAAESAVIGPCEVTPDQSGYLARGGAGVPAVTAVLPEAARQELKQRYPLLKLLNPAAYRQVWD